MSHRWECADVHAVLAGEREDDLTSDESRALEAHLEACAACRDGLSRVEDDLDRLSSLVEAPAVPDAGWARVDEAVRAEARRAPGREDLQAPLEPLEAAPAAAASRAVATPARPLVPAQPQAALAHARRSRRTGFRLSFAVALVALTFCTFALSPRPRGDVRGIGRVRAPEPDDVQVVKVEVGDRYKQAADGPKYIMIFQGE